MPVPQQYYSTVSTVQQGFDFSQIMNMIMPLMMMVMMMSMLMPMVKQMGKGFE